MRRVLIISYYWPPSGGSGVQRWVKMSKYLPDCGWQPVIYTPLNPAYTAIDDSLAADIPQEVEILRRRIVEPGQFARKTTSAQVTPINGQKKTLKQKIAMWVRGNLFIPDPRVLWVRPSVNFLKKYLKEHPVDAIISTGPPHSMHLIARRLSLETGLPWIADFRDPWTRMFYFKYLSLGKWSKKKHQILENRVLDDATRIVAVSPLVREEFAQMTATPVELITNGYDRTDFENVPAPSRDRFVIAHAGLFADGGNPTELWAALGELCAENPEFRKDLLLRLCGKTDKAVTDSIHAAGLGDREENLGYVDHAKAVAVMCSASMLILPLRCEPEYRAVVPGKVFEYLASRRPILGIGQTDGAMAMIVQEAGAGKVVQWDEREEMKRYVRSCHEKWKAGEAQSPSADISKYSRDALAARYAELLNKITEKR